MKKLLTVVTTLLLLGGVQQVQAQVFGTAPQTFWRETDQTLPLGMWHVQVNNDRFVIEKNTANDGAFGTTTTFVAITGGSVSITGLALSGFTTGSVLYSRASGAISQDNANFFWDATNHRLGIGTTGPGATLHVVGAGGSVSSSRMAFFTDNNSAIGANLAIGWTGAGADAKYKSLFIDSNGLNFGKMTDALNALPASQMVISTTGNVGIGTTNPSSFTLQVAGSIGPNTDNTTDGGASGTRFRSIYTGTSVIVGSGTGTIFGAMSGHTYFGSLATSSANQTGGICIDTSTMEIFQDTVVGGCVTSSMAFKRDWNLLDSEASRLTVMAMDPYSFYRKDPSIIGEQIGFLAERAFTVEPRLVGIMEGKIHSFDYQGYTAVLTGAFQVHDREIEDLKARIQALETK